MGMRLNLLVCTYHDGSITVVELRFSFLHVFVVVLNNW